ncbi:hypothetical protein KUTeg_010078 [Tegillarca granosa]|uniref:Uncharacterized protein n=1 Tax=Tegillarca granosa TaxID=220873 RepID=A0ABQ9FAQ7_TEGGR|nr:hypothetical protein KUTeg_010078 [Tegillarca granosa]
MKILNPYIHDHIVSYNILTNEFYIHIFYHFEELVIMCCVILSLTYIYTLYMRLLKHTNCIVQEQDQAIVETPYIYKDMHYQKQNKTEIFLKGLNFLIHITIIVIYI